MKLVKGPRIPGKMDEDMQAEIDNMSRFRMAWLIRFAPVGSAYLMGEVGEYLKQRFKSLGGWSDELSDMVGRDDPNPQYNRGGINGSDHS